MLRFCLCIFVCLFSGVAFAGGGISTPRVGGLGPHGPNEGDVSSIYWNPASLTLLSKKFRLVVDVTFTSARGEVLRTVDENGQPIGNNELPANDPVPLAIDLPVPFLGAVYRPTPKLAAGIALMVPIGRTGDYLGECRQQSPVEVDVCEKTAVTRYQTTRSILQSIFVTPSVAYQITPKLSLGAGVNIAYSQFSGDSAFDLSGQEDPENAAFLHIGAVIADGKDNEGVFLDDDADGVALIDLKPLSGIGLGANLGLHYQASDKLSLALSYSSRTRAKTKGNAVAEAFLGDVTLAPTQEGEAEVSFTMPDNINAGVRFSPNELVDLDLWAQYSTYVLHDKIDINLVGFRDGVLLNREPNEEEDLPGTAIARQFQNNISVNVGASYKAPNRKTRVGGAIMYEGSAIPDEAQTAASIDGAKLDFLSYVEYTPNEKLYFTLGYSLILGLGPVDNTGNSIFRGTFENDPDNGYNCLQGNDPATGLCFPAGDGVYQVGVGRVGLTVAYSF